MCVADILGFVGVAINFEKLFEINFLIVKVVEKSLFNNVVKN